MKIGKLGLLLFFALTLIAARGCRIGNGTIEGTVTNSLSGDGLAGVEVTLTPGITVSTSQAAEPVVVTTDENGAYSASVQRGNYTIAFTKDNFNSATGIATVSRRLTVTVNASLEPTAKVIVSAGPDQDGEFDASVSLNGTVEILDGSDLVGYKWTQTAGVDATLNDDTSLTASAQMGTKEASKAAVLAGLEQPDRLMVQGINPHALEEGKTATFKLTVTTSSGSYSDSANVELPLGLAVASGIRNVPINVPVLIHGTDQESYGWEILSKPAGSAAALEDSTTQDPYFTPDVSGAYLIEQEITEATIAIFAGTYVGGINGQDAEGNPTMTCSQCHSATVEEWAPSGHAHIFSDNVNTSDHYSESCLPCHTVGYLSGANGIDEASDWDAFIDSGLLHDTSPTNWTTILADYPATAQLSNIQCENCHGPQSSGIHVQGRAARISISSDVCGTCHGEPPRHGRYQQWEESGHGNFELAIEEGLSSNCARCHAGQGFLAYIQQPDLTKNLQGADGNATEEELIALGCGPDQVQPQTCAVCHDPHFVGTVSGDATDATVRIEGDTPILASGFKATNVGKGAICFVCHNTRRGLRNDANPPTSFSAPHEPSQADVMMGQNVFFVEVGQRSSHANLKNSCVTCHMEATPPPAGFSYNQSGTNHSFEASITICSQCHTGLSGAALQGSTELMIEDLSNAIKTAAITKLNALGTINVRAYDPATDLYSSDDSDICNVSIDVSANPITGIEVESGHGQIEFAITLTTPIEIIWTDASTTTTNMFGVQLQSLRDGSDILVYDYTGNMTRACWNYLIIKTDLSKGVHNPSFVSNVLMTTTEKDLSF